MAEALVRRSSSKGSQSSTVDDLSLPSPRTPIFDGDQTFEIPERCNSESDLTLLDDTASKLNVSGRQFTLGNCGKVKVTWDIKEEYGADDWIGLFPFGMYIQIQSTLVISNSKGLTEILRDIRTSTYQS